MIQKSCNLSNCPTFFRKSLYSDTKKGNLYNISPHFHSNFFYLLFAELSYFSAMSRCRIYLLRCISNVWYPSWFELWSYFHLPKDIFVSREYGSVLLVEKKLRSEYTFWMMAFCFGWLMTYELKRNRSRLCVSKTGFMMECFKSWKFQYEY